MVLPGSAETHRTIIVNDESTETTGQLEPNSFAVDGNGRIITTSISGTGAPTTQFSPALGSLYIDINNDKVYTIIGGTSGAPQWKQTDANWGLDDLTLDNNRIHNLDGNSLSIRTDGTNRIHTIDPNNYKIAFGDIDSASNQTLFEINDNNSEIVLSGTTGSALTVNTSSGAVNINEEYTFPTVDGANLQVLTTNGSGSVYFDYANPLTKHTYSDVEFNTTSTTDVIITGMTTIIDIDGNYHFILATFMGHSSGSDRVSEFSIYVNGVRDEPSVKPIFTTDIDDFHQVFLMAHIDGLSQGDEITVRCKTENNTLTVYTRNLHITRVLTT